MKRVSMFSGLGILCLAFLVGAGTSQDAKKDKDAKKEGKVKGMLPAGFKDLGLSAEQVQKIYTVQTEYNMKIADLTKQINELKSKRSKEEFNVLTPAQRDTYLKNKGLEVKDKGKDEKKVDTAKKAEDKK
jgi:hypothetical protein